MEIETPVEVLSVEYVCDHCHRGRMKPVRDYEAPAATLSAPRAPYLHKCSECGEHAELDKLYPDIIYRMAHLTVALLN